MNKESEAVKESCLLARRQLHELEKNCNRLNRLLEHAVWEKDMVQEEQIVFTGSTQEFLSLLEPLLRSNQCKVNGKSNREAFLRVIDSVVKIQPEKGSEPIKFVSLLELRQIKSIMTKRDFGTPLLDSECITFLYFRDWNGCTLLLFLLREWE